MKVLQMIIGAVLVGATAVSPAAAAAPEPMIKLQVTGPAKPVAVGNDIELEVLLSTEGEVGHTFQLGSFSQVFGIYILGPWGVVQPDPTKIRPELWMHQFHSKSEEITVAKGKPYRTTVNLSKYFKVTDPDAFKPGGYQVNVKFHEGGAKLTAPPIDSGAVRFELTPRP